MKVKYKLSLWDKYDHDRWLAAIVISIAIVFLSIGILKHISMPKFIEKSKDIFIDIVFSEQDNSPVDPTDNGEKEKGANGGSQNGSDRMDFQGEHPGASEPGKMEDAPVLDPQPGLAPPPFEETAPEPNNEQQGSQEKESIKIQNKQANSSPAIQDPVTHVQPTGNSHNTKLPIGGVPDRPENGGKNSLPGKELGNGTNLNYSDFAEAADPLISYIYDHQKFTGKISSGILTNSDKTMKTTKFQTKLGGRLFDVLLAGRKDTKQINVFLVDIQTNRVFYVIIHGVARKKSKAMLGNVRRNDQGEIVQISCQQEKTNNSTADHYLSLFLSWVKGNIK